jgi:hypothetical protein
MNRRMQRRDALARLAAMAILPALVSASPLRAQPGSSGFSPPRGPMQFTRRLRRDLGDGAAIEVVRTFDIRFVAMAGGFRVEGSQTSARVSAPAKLAAFAHLEEQRQETSLFPMLLDGAGRIIAGPQGAVPADFGPVVDEAFAWLARNRVAAPTQAAAREFTIGLATVAARISSVLPPDLFTGATTPVERAQDLTMPDGKPGRVTVACVGQAIPAGGLLKFAERVVVTDAGGSSRRSVEQWSLEPLPAVVAR